MGMESSLDNQWMLKITYTCFYVMFSDYVMLTEGLQKLYNIKDVVYLLDITGTEEINKA